MAALTKQQAELYDRQIRLWGVEAQQRMQTSNVLLIGLSGVHTEVAKNLVLAGVNVTIADSRIAIERTWELNFFLLNLILV